MFRRKRRAVVFVPGGRVEVLPEGDTLEGTNTANRCKEALRVAKAIYRQYDRRVIIYTAGNAGHEGQRIATGALSAWYIRSLPKYIGEEIVTDEGARDTYREVDALREKMASIDWWPEGQKPSFDLYIVSERSHTRRIWVYLWRRYRTIAKKRPTNDKLTIVEWLIAQALTVATICPRSEHVIALYTDRTRNS